MQVVTANEVIKISTMINSYCAYCNTAGSLDEAFVSVAKFYFLPQNPNVGYFNGIAEIPE